MSLCTKCGAVLNDEDTGHVCDPANIPAKGKEKIPNSTEKDI